MDETSDGEVPGVRVAAYIRVSTEDQAKKFGLAVQQHCIEHYVNCKLWPQATIYADVESGASTAGRDQFNVMCEHIKERMYDRVVALRVDRLGRDVMDVMEFAYRKAIPFGCHVICMDQGVDTATPTGKMLLMMLGWAAELELKHIKERTVAGKERSLDAGRWWGGKPPYGYAAGKEKDHVGILQVDEYEADVVRHIYRLRYKDKATVAGIAQWLNNHGWQTRKARADPGDESTSVWGENGVANMLAAKRRLFYLGKANQWGEIVQTPVHKAILSEGEAA